MKFLFLIQARLTSTRLPRKIFACIGNRPLLVHIPERLNQLRNIPYSWKIISPHGERTEILNSLKKYNITEENTGEGDARDVLSRYLKNSTHLDDADYIIRLTADNPFLVWDILQKNLESVMLRKPDYSYPYGLPLGMGYEIIRAGALRNIDRLALENYHREHVTVYFREKTQDFRIDVFPIVAEKNRSIRLTIDEPRDLSMARKVYNHFNAMNLPFFSHSQVMDLFRENPDFFRENRTVYQKAATESQKSQTGDMETARPQVLLFALWGKAASGESHGLGHLYRMREVKKILKSMGIPSLLLNYSRRGNFSGTRKPMSHFPKAKIIILDARDGAFPEFPHPVFRIALDNRGEGRKTADYLWDSLPHFSMDKKQFRKSLRRALLPASLFLYCPHASQSVIHEAETTPPPETAFLYPPEKKTTPEELLQRMEKSPAIYTHFGQTMLAGVYLGKKILLHSPSPYHKKLGQEFIRQLSSTKMPEKYLDGRGMERFCRFIQRLAEK